MNQKYTSTTTVFKMIYFIFLSTISVVVIVGALFVLDDPRFKAPSLVTGLKRLYYSASYHSANFGATEPQSTLAEGGDTARSVPILAYHGILKNGDESNINVTISQFKEHMFALKRAGYTSITLQDLYAFAREGKELPHRPIMITFDDGRSDSFYNADPILDAVNFSAVTFVITDYAQKAQLGGYYLTTDEIRHAANTGRWEIGSHSAGGHDAWKINAQGDVGNFFSNNLWIDSEQRNESEEEFIARVTDDYRRSQVHLENLLGTGVQSFAFPFGDIGQNNPDREKVKKIEDTAAQFYTLLFYQQRSGEYFTQYIHDAKNDGAALVRRINMQNSWDAEALLNKLSDGTEKALPYHDNFDDDRGWLSLWSEVSVDTENGSLVLRARPDTAGASTILDGTQLWNNYTVTAYVTSPNRTGVVIWTRFQNDFTNASCNFGTDFVFAEQTIEGEKRVLKGVQRPNSIPEGPFTVRAESEGRTLICSINGMEIVRTEFLDPLLSRGGIGFKTWDKEFGKSSIIIHEVTVDPVREE